MHPARRLRPRQTRTAFALAAVLAGTIATQAAAEDVYVPVQTQEVRGYAMVQGVNARTGNFSLTYEAFMRQGFNYRRTYNSSGPIRGIFGLGWGSVLDTRAVGMADGRIAVIENGNGVATVYGPGPQGETAAQQEQAVAAALAHPKDIFRDAIGAKFRIETPYAQTDAAGCDEAVMATKLNGYVRITCKNRTEVFDEKGRLAQYAIDGDMHYEVRVVRDAGGEIESLRDNIGHRLTFVRTPTTLKATDDEGETITYEFDARGRNVRVSGSKMPTYRYDYGPAGLMSQINFIDTTARKIAYDATGRVTKLTERDGSTTEFQYRPASNATLVIQRPAGGEPKGLLLKFID